MDTKFYIRMAALAASALLAAACIYPYAVDIEKRGEYPLVVEGDILIGGTTTVKVSHVRPFKQEEEEVEQVFAQGFIEGEDGSRAQGIPEFNPASTVLSFDTSNLNAGQRYRLVFETVTADGKPVNRYESDWLTPTPPPVIDALTYAVHDEFGELWIGLTMHCNGSHYFRWSFSETWQYHSDLHAGMEYVPIGWDPETGQRTGGYYQTPPTLPLYYCWKTEQSSQINIFSTVNQTEDRFEELAFHTVPLDDNRLMVLYRITVQLQAISENAYNYWNNILQNSQEQGSIFSPVPSEMASNIHCVSDPSIQVMGYLNAAVPCTSIMFYDNETEGFYRHPRPFERYEEKLDANDTAKAEKLFKAGYLPYQALYEASSPSASHYMWAMGNCVDCRKQGGTKTRPDDWPRGDI